MMRQRYDMKIREIKAKSILQKSGVPGADWVINPYTGCTHACVYCYAAFMKKWTGHMVETWGKFVDVKINTPELLQKEIKKVKSGEEVFLSSVCDPYQEVEKKYKLMRYILEIIADYAKEHKISVSILTKSKLVIRDIDILKKIKDIDVGFSLGAVERKYQKITEPGTASSRKRAKTMKKLHDAGIKTYLFISPIIPGISSPKKSVELTKGAFDYLIKDLQRNYLKILPIAVENTIRYRRTEEKPRGCDRSQFCNSHRNNRRQDCGRGKQDR